MNNVDLAYYQNVGYVNLEQWEKVKTEYLKHRDLLDMGDYLLDTKRHTKWVVWIPNRNGALKIHPTEHLKVYF
jgi:hypothetical protein